MGRLTTARLSDGRLQLWVCYPSLLSTWQVSLDPGAAWTPLSQFDPDPGRVISLAAGYSPDGRAQIWALGYDNVLRTTWKITGDPNAGWFPWEAFLDQQHLTGYQAPTVGQLSDGRMQMWVMDADFAIWTTWKQSTVPNASWTNWQSFNPATPGMVLAAGNVSDGALQIWAKVYTAESEGFSTSGALMSAWKVTSDPNSSWTTWQDPFLPELVSGAYKDACGAGQLSDGRLQLWGVTSDGKLHTTWKSSTNPNAAWTDWQNHSPDPGDIEDLTVGRLADGRLQLWVASPVSNGTYQILTSQKASQDPNASWTPWITIGTVG